MEFSNENKPRLWLNTGHFVNDIYTGMLNPIMPFIAVKLGITMAIATVVLSLSHICASLLQPLFGFFADNMGKRSFIFWGLMSTAIFISFAPGTVHLYPLIAFVILGSLGSSLFHPQALGSVVNFSGPENISRNMGVFMGCGTIGFALGPIVSSGVTQFLGLEKMPFLASAGVFTALMMFAFVPKTAQVRAGKSHEDFIQTFRTILSDRKLNLLNVIAMLKSLVTTSCCILLPFLWKDMGYNPFYIGFALFAFNFAGGIGSFISRRFEMKIGTRNVFYFSMIMPFPMIILFMLTYKVFPSFALITFILIGLIQWMAVPVTMVMAQSVLPEYKSIIGGFINGFSWGVVAIAMTIIGFIAQSRGIMPVLIVVALIPAILSYPIVKKLFSL